MESKIEKELARLLKADGWDVHHAECIAQGFPDILALSPFGYVLIEVKALGGAYRPAQKRWHKDHDWGTVYRLEETHDAYHLWSALKEDGPLVIAYGLGFIADFLTQHHWGGLAK